MSLPRFARFLIVAVLLVLPLLSAGPGRTVAQSMPPEAVTSFRGDPGRTGVMPGPGPNPNDVIDDVWRFDDGGYAGLPIVADHTVYLPTTYDFYALDAVTGSILWNAGIGGGYGVPALAGDLVLAPSDDLLIAFARGTGAERWRFQGGATLGYPLVVDDVVLVTSTTGDIFALLAATGEERWRFPLDRWSGDWPPLIAAGDGVVSFGTNDGTVYALDLAMGTELWRFDAFADVDYVSVASGLVIAGGLDGGVHAIDAATGLERWWYLGLGDMNAPAVTYNTVYIGSSIGRMLALDLQTGDELWRFDGAESLDLPVVANDIIYVGDAGGRLHAVDAITGLEHWSFTFLNAKGWAVPNAVADGMVFVTTSYGTLYALANPPLALESGGRATPITMTKLLGAPAPTGVERATLEPGADLELIGEPESKGNLTYWPVLVLDSGMNGWVLAEDLEPTALSTDRGQPTDSYSTRS